MLKIILTTMLFLFLTSCASLGLGDLKFDDGTWSMCQLKTKDGLMLNLPLQVALPVGAETPDGTVVQCTPIPAATGP